MLIIHKFTGPKFTSCQVCVSNTNQTLIMSDSNANSSDNRCVNQFTGTVELLFESAQSAWARGSH